MFEIKDLAGLSKPLKKLVEVIAEGIGGVSRPLLTRRNADARAYEIRTIAAAISDSQKLLSPAVATDTSIQSRDEAELLSLPEASLNKRIAARVSYQETKKQINIEQITQHAADELRGETEVSPDHPDSDWTTRFFGLAENVTTPEMQRLWGKILAGEVKRPKSYSMRTLDLLKNLTQREAELFVIVARLSFIFEDGGKAFIPIPNEENYFLKRFELDFEKLLLLRDIGLLTPLDLTYTLPMAHDDEISTFVYGRYRLVIERPQGTPEISVPSIVFTEPGRELLQLIEREPEDLDYLRTVFSLFENKGGSITMVGPDFTWKGKV